MRIELSDDATTDLQDIADYTFQTWGSEQEEVYLGSLYRKLQDVSDDPDRWARRDDLFEGCQTVSVGRHVIFFRVGEEVVLVSRILHQAMDFRRHLFL
jgi:toxin ParE1/3/4